MMVAWLAMLTQAAAPAAAAPPAPPVRPLQQAFDAALALDADAAARPAARAAAWLAIALRARGNRRTVAIAQLHEGGALVQAGRPDEGLPLVRAGLAALPAGDATLRAFRYDALVVLARDAERTFDYADAAERRAEAEAIAQDATERYGALLGIVRTATYTNPDAATAAIGRADALVRSVKTEPAAEGMLRRYQAELLLNRGDVAGARRTAALAVKLMGGLTSKTDSNDVSVRSDYAIAALLAGAPNEAREYLAMTGAGRMPNGVFGRGVDTSVPDCGGEAGLKPDDMAVVEFTVAEDGHTTGVRPVYAAGGGAVALEFARAVAGWSWTPEQLKSVPPFFRNRVRLEMRCSTAFERPSVARYFDGRFVRWLGEHDLELPAPPAAGDAAALPAERAMLAAAEARDGKEALSLAPLLWTIARNHVTAREETHAAATRLLAIAERNGAPAGARLAIDLVLLDQSEADAPAALAALASRYAGDPETRGGVALAAAERQERRPDKVRALLRPIATDPRLDADNPVRAAALVRLASLEDRARRPDEARALYAQAKIAPEACALIDSPPRLLHAGGEFPAEAMRWGFEGWTQLQYDISPAGKVSNERAIIAYPPFVFTKAAIATMADAQFAKTFRPDGQLGCGGNTGGVSFRMP